MTPSEHNTMACPSCGNTTGRKVIDSRTQRNHRRRRYACTPCGGRFSTAEVVTRAGDDMWIKTTAGGDVRIRPMNDWLAQRVERAKIAIEDAFKGA